MSWFTAPPAQYVILRLGEKSPAFSTGGIKPSDVKNQLIGTKVGTLKPFNEVVYKSASNQKDFSFTVVEVSLGNKNASYLARSETAVISRMTQVFLSNSNQNGVFCFSTYSRDFCLHTPYSDDDSALALRMHDPSTVRSILGNTLTFGTLRFNTLTFYVLSFYILSFNTLSFCTPLFFEHNIT